MMLTWSLTIAGFILILLELKVVWHWTGDLHLSNVSCQGLTETLMDNPHAFIGFVTVGLCFIQPFLALIRCSPNDSMRPLFNWVHWLIGNKNSLTLSFENLTFACNSKLIKEAS